MSSIRVYLDGSQHGFSYMKHYSLAFWIFVLIALRGEQISFSQELNLEDDSNTSEQTEDPEQDPLEMPMVKKSSSSKSNASANKELESAQADEAEKMRLASSTQVRRFHEVLDELLAEFGYDIKMGQIKGLSQVAIRKIRVSKAIPRTYEDYMETLLAERIRDNSQIKLIACVPCKTRTSSLVEGKILITSPATNLAKLESAAALLGINYFMDAVLVYHTTHMVLAIDVFNSQTKELVWAKTYNSETIKSRYQKLAIDYSQVAKARPGEDYVPEYRTMFGLGGAIMPNLSGKSEDNSMLNLQVRGTEKFMNRRSEFGMLLSILKTAQSTITEYPTEGGEPSGAEAIDQQGSSSVRPKAFEQAFALYGIYTHVMVGAVESYNEIRHGMNFGLGGLFATGYIAPTFRFAWDVFLGRRFVTSAGLDLVGPSSVLIKGKTVSTSGGAGGHILLSLTY